MKKPAILLAGLLLVVSAMHWAGIKRALQRFMPPDIAEVIRTQVYVSAPGDTIEVKYRADGSIEVSFIEVDGDYMKAFAARPDVSASGARYRSLDGRFIFWSKRNDAMILGADDALIFQGVANTPKP